MFLDDFFYYQTQTTPHAPGLVVSKAEGNYIYDQSGKAYLDFVAGVSANTLGHSHPDIVQAITKQAEKYLHVMVYGEYALEKPVELCKKLAEITPPPLETTYLVNSGAEAIEGALKLAKRYTGREEIVSAYNAYHGNTHGALSVSGNEDFKRQFRPLLPQVSFIRFNEMEDLERITTQTAAVILETIQGAAGCIVPQKSYLQAVKQRCEQTGALLILDEIQPGFGRTGSWFAFEHYGIVPDILVMGKGMAGGVPIGAFMSSHEMMQCLSHHPPLGHITTFGGNPIPAAASLAMITYMQTHPVREQIDAKENLFRELLVHDAIEEIAGKGLMLAMKVENKKIAQQIVQACMDEGLILFYMLYKGNYIRITPPLTITEEEIQKGCSIILKVLHSI